MPSGLTPRCAGPQINATWSRFTGLYRAKAYARTAPLLETVLQECSKFLTGPVEGSMRNDLAITFYHLGRYDACLATLAPVAVRALKSDEELESTMAPFDFQEYLPVARATRHNHRLCTQRRSAK